MKRMNKRGRIFALGMFIVLTLALSRIYFLSITRSNEISGEFNIGSNQIAFFMSIQEAQKSVLYGEQGFGFVLHQSLHDAGSLGGYDEPPICGKFGNYTVWRKNNNTECYPSINNFRESMASSIKEKMPNYLAISSKDDYGDYEIFIEQKGEKLSAKAYAMSNLVQDIRCNYAFSPETGGDCGDYYYNPSFSRIVNFNLDDFEEIVQIAEKLANDVESCTDVKNSCVNKALIQANSDSKFNWGLCEVTKASTKTFPVCVSIGKKALTYDKSKDEIRLDDITVKFALSFV